MKTDQTDVRLREEIKRLGPWHLDVQVTPEVSTRVSLEVPPDEYPPDLGPVSFIRAREAFRARILQLYPNGLEGRRVLDCACNCGGYLFWAKELGAGDCFGFDVRELWIDQARFLAENRTFSTDGIQFEVCNLYDLPKLELEPFDLTIFKGLFYHLPDPVTGLKIAADLTRELIIVDTAMRVGLPDEMLVISPEDTVMAMSGVYGLCWYPSGPRVVELLLHWMGFGDTRCTRWVEHGPRQSPDTGRLEVIGARSNGLVTRVPPFGEFERRESVTTARRAGSSDLAELLWSLECGPEAVITEVAPEDPYRGSGADAYFRAGQSALQNIRLVLLAAGKSRVDRVLDFGSGYGRILRTLKAAFPAATLAACDIEREAVEFCGRVLGATPIHSKATAEEIVIGDKFDLIWCGSFFPHLDSDRWQEFLELFDSLLEPEGVLVFTTPGQGVAERLRGATDGLTDGLVRGLIEDCEQAGFGYRNYSDSANYGMSLASPSWVCQQVEQVPGLRLIAYQERGWNDHEDVVGCLGGSLSHE